MSVKTIHECLHLEDPDKPYLEDLHHQSRWSVWRFDSARLLSQQQDHISKGRK